MAEGRRSGNLSRRQGIPYPVTGLPDMGPHGIEDESIPVAVVLFQNGFHSLFHTGVRDDDSVINNCVTDLGNTAKLDRDTHLYASTGGIDSFLNEVVRRSLGHQIGIFGKNMKELLDYFTVCAEGFKIR